MPSGASVYMTYYELLGVAPNATLQQIESAYRQLALQCHPDKQRTEEGSNLASLQFHQLNLIKAALSDPEKRRHYDQAPQRLPNLVEQAKSDRLAAVIKLLQWRQPNATEFHLMQQFGEDQKAVLKLTKEELLGMDLPVSPLRGDGLKLPVRNVIQKMLQFVLRRYAEDNLLMLEAEITSTK